METLDTSLSITQYLIERVLFEKLRLTSVKYGYMPDILKYPRTEDGARAYSEKMARIAKEKGFVIAIKNNIHSTELGEKTVPRMVVETVQCIPGEFGQWGRTQYQMGSDGMYKKYKLPPQPVNYTMQIHLVSNSLEQQRVMNAILARAIPRRGYHQVTADIYEDIPGAAEVIGEAGPTFFCELTVSRVYPDPANNLKEDVFQYNIPDAWDITLVDTDEVVSPLNEVGVTLQTIAPFRDADYYFEVK